MIVQWGAVPKLQFEGEVFYDTKELFSKHNLGRDVARYCESGDWYKNKKRFYLNARAIIALAFGKKTQPVLDFVYNILNLARKSTTAIPVKPEDAMGSNSSAISDAASAPIPPSAFEAASPRPLIFDPSTPRGFQDPNTPRSFDPLTPRAFDLMSMPSMPVPSPSASMDASGAFPAPTWMLPTPSGRGDEPYMQDHGHTEGAPSSHDESNQMIDDAFAAFNQQVATHPSQLYRPPHLLFYAQNPSQLLPQIGSAQSAFYSATSGVKRARTEQPMELQPPQKLARYQ